MKKRRPQQDVRMWRRGPAPTAAGPHDYGTYGPDSVAWKVLTHNAVPAMVVPVTALLQFTHAGMGANFLDHDPLLKQGRKPARPEMIVSRHRRTVGVVVPAISGDQATAERICAHLRRFHSHMQGTIPRSGEPYDAAGPDLVLYGHVSLMHGALLSYERAGYHGLRAPRRLSDAERDRFWTEVVPFAVMMGANEADVPRTTAEVRAFYASCEGDYYNFDLILREVLRAAREALVSPARWREDPRAAFAAALIVMAHLPALGIIPRPARRHAGVPAVLDPVIEALFRLTRPAYASLSIPAVGDRLTAWTVGPDGAELILNARQLMATTAQDSVRDAA
jgi:uncharacterized protein (DUF2236 family)